MARLQREKMNEYGVTWKAWACAARVAKFKGSAFVPYTTSDVVSMPTPTRHQLVGGIIGPAYRLRRRTTQNYPTALYQAWLRGEDPTDHAAQQGKVHE